MGYINSCGGNINLGYSSADNECITPPLIHLSCDKRGSTSEISGLTRGGGLDEVKVRRNETLFKGETRACKLSLFLVMINRGVPA